MGLPAKRYWDPFADMRRLMKEMDEAFESGSSLPAEWGPRMPLSDIEDKGDELVLTAELPGMQKEDIKIDIDRNSVTVSAERKHVDEKKKKDYYYCERSYSGYKRTFGLPEEIDPEGSEAEYREGLLKVTMKKVKKAAQKKELTVK
ncbi:MAG: Hsp20/alpha crystallin family protein [Candidatus Micrarchaeota archaeon]